MDSNFSIKELGEEIRGAKTPFVLDIEDDDGVSRSVLATPDGKGGWSHETVKRLLKDYAERPDRRKGQANLADLASFVAHVKRFADSDSAIFADRSGASPCLLAVLDYHHAGSTSEPRFGQHRARYGFPLSNEWMAWQASNGNPFDQESFARFIEDRLVDVADPEAALDNAKDFAKRLSCGFASPSNLLTLSRGLSVSVGRRVANHANLATGEATVSFAEEHADAAGKPLKVPGAFLVAIPVFRSGALYQVPARLRYRVQGGSLSWSYDLHGLDRVFDHALGEACEIAQKETGLPLFYGTPEA